MTPRERAEKFAHEWDVEYCLNFAGLPYHKEDSEEFVADLEKVIQEAVKEEREAIIKYIEEDSKMNNGKPIWPDVMVRVIRKRGE